MNLLNWGTNCRGSHCANLTDCSWYLGRRPFVSAVRRTGCILHVYYTYIRTMYIRSSDFYLCTSLQQLLQRSSALC